MKSKREKMLAFHSDEKIKQKYLTRIQEHFDADEIIKGSYWEDGKGCAVGCTIHGSRHKDYEAELGIPEWLAQVEDCIFEGLPNDRAKLWPKEVLEAIAPGADLNKIEHPFIVFVLKSTLANFDNEKYSDIVKSINDVIELHEKDEPDGSAAWSATESAAWSAAWSAVRSARSTTESAVRSVAESAAWSAAWSAVRSAAESARSTTESAAWSAAWSAVRSVAESAVRSAAWSARSTTYVKFADHLLELMRGCK